MPQKFKPPKFLKYDGTSDPCAHLCMFCRKMAPYGDNQPLLSQVFQDSLIGSAATWFESGKSLEFEGDVLCFLGF